MARGQEPAEGDEPADRAAATAPGAAPAAPAPPPANIYTSPPQTPLELWDAADYLIRIGQPAQAVPYLRKFLDANPDDATLLAIRDRYGARSILRLQDNPATRALAAPLSARLAAATRRHATRPERLERFIAALTRSQEEQDYAVERLREAGPFAVPPLVRELDKSSLTPEARALVVRNMGRLDLSAVPALVAALDGAASKPLIAAGVAEALGAIGDRRALPALTILATSASAPVPAREAARRAIVTLTGRSVEEQPKTPVRLLTDEARGYHLHAVKFPGDPVVLWAWDDAQHVPVPRTVPRTEAEAILGTKLARAALALDPADRQAQVVLLILVLEKAVERAGFARYPAGDPTNSFASALAAGPGVLGDVLRQAIADGKDELAAVAATALGQVTDANALAVEGRVNPLVEALSAPGRRARFAAARALVTLDPARPFAGSSRVVTVLTQFVRNQAAPRALVVDGNPVRGGRLVGYLKALGYEPMLAATGDEGFRLAAESGDLELIVLDHHLIQGVWRLADTLANLKADPRTAGVPVYVVAPLQRQADLASLPSRFPGVTFLVTPTSPETLKSQLAIVGRPETIPDAERAGYAREATAFLARIAARPNSPFAPDLTRAESALTFALNAPATGVAASAALGDVPDPEAQRGLADVLTDPSQTSELRLSSASQLARSIQRFGPLVTADQEAALLAAFDREADPALRSALGAVIGALRPQADATGLRLRQLGPDASAPTAPNPAPTPAPASPSPEAQP
jgi:CheY-like chemotaxis protein